MVSDKTAKPTTSTFVARKNEEDQGREAQGPRGSRNEHQEYHHCCFADDADAVCCTLYVGYQQRLQQS